MPVCPLTRPSPLILLLQRVLHPEREQGKGTSLQWGDRGPLDPCEVVVKIVFLGLWCETVAVAQGV